MYLLLHLLPLAFGRDFFIDYIQNNLDHSVRPCDNFFQHACPERKKADFYLNSKALELSVEIASYQSKDWNGLKDVLSHGIKSKLTFKESYQEKIMSGCANMKEPERQNHLSHLENLFEYAFSKRNCHAAAVSLTDYIFTEDFIEETKYKYEASMMSLRPVAEATAYNRYIQDPANKFSDVNDRLSAIFEHMKNLLIWLIENTPWIAKKGLGKAYECKVKDIVMIPFEYNPIHERTINMTVAGYYDCASRIVRNFGATHSLDIMRYLTKSAEKALKLFEQGKSPMESGQKKLSKDGPLVANAQYIIRLNTVVMFPTLLKDDMATNPFSMASGNCFTIVDTSDRFLGIPSGSRALPRLLHSVMVPQAALAGLSSFIRDLCRRENDYYDCGNLTKQEDAVDWLAMRLAKFTADNLQEAVPSQLDLLQDQLFFYSSAITMCSLEYTPGDSHTPTTVRIRAILMQHPDFSKAFGCEPGDEMFTEKERFVSLLGSDNI